MKYINAKELLMFLQPPVTRLSVFVAETVDATLEMCAKAFPPIEQQFQATIDFPTFKFQLLKTMSEFIEERKSTDVNLQNPRAKIAEERYQHAHILRSLWPVHLQKMNGENFFIMEYVTTIADILYRYLLDSGIEKDVAQAIASQCLESVAKWIDLNCINKCNYECIRRYDSNGYCALCTFMIQPLPCPKKQEISFERTGMAIAECNCMRK